MMTGAWPLDQIDHENGVHDDNRWSNLREATNTENQHNRGISRRNTSGLPRVSRHATGKHRADIGHGGRQIYLGNFASPEQAFAAFLAAKAILHPFAPTPRGVALPKLYAVDRMKASRRIVKVAQRQGNKALEFDAWDHFIAAM